MIVLRSKKLVNGIEFRLQMSMVNNGYNGITTIGSYGDGENGKGFQLSVNYEGEESLKLHLSKVQTTMEYIAESLNGWGSVIEHLENEGFERVISE
jgi:hypothetical protein